ncbi:hypothetical protein [Brachybacterium sp. FME24]|uniref:hypothetical protein n=1 Tax=Brachybacterium sp. FME24 TaxID=2742605 RepID=UPI0018688588|nr:hypothetical protein [Brachybacterium sp. FME24]
MSESPVHPADPSGSDAAPDDAAAAVGDATSQQAPDSGVGFGDREPTRFAADVEYRGRAEEHDYLVRVRHRFLDTTFTVVIDGIEHDPKAEEKTRKTVERGKNEREKDDEDASAEKGAAEGVEGPDDAAGNAAPADDLQFRLEENFTVLYCTVRRPDDDGDLHDAEVIAVRTAGLGGAGEVDVRHGLERSLLVPEDDSPSAVRDVKRLAHPARYALVAALAKAAGFLIPLLGFGALFSGLLDPVKEWIGALIRPVIDAIVGVIEPVRRWVAELLRPVQEFLDALFAPVRAFFAALLRPVVDAWNWLMDLLFGWIPDLSLPFSVPEWVIDVSVPVIVVLVVFVVTFSGLRRRQAKLDATRAASSGGAGAMSGSERADGTTEDVASDETIPDPDGVRGAGPEELRSHAGRSITADHAKSEESDDEMTSMRTTEHASSPE